MRVSDFDMLYKKVEALSMQGAQLSMDVEARSQRTEAIADGCRESRQVTQGLDVLGAIARRKADSLGKALQRVLAMRLMERIRACPARPPVGDRAVAGRARQEQTAIAFEVPFPRSGVDELVAMLFLSYSSRTGRRTARQTRTVQFEGAAAVLAALGLPIVQDNMCRKFSRKDGPAPERALIERLVDDSGTLFYVLGRDKHTGDVRVSARESEAYHVRRRCFVHSLKERSIARNVLPEAPEHSPSFISWRESCVSAYMDG